MSTALSGNALQFLQINTVQVNANHPDLPEQCPICHEEFDFGADDLPVQVIGVPNCSHIFGRSCLTEWFSSGNPNVSTCPMCRTQLYGEDEGEVDRQAMLRRVHEAQQALEAARQRWEAVVQAQQECDQLFQEDIQRTLEAGPEARRLLLRALEEIKNDGSVSEAGREEVGRIIAQINEAD
ncbi:hypothetical protein BU16DRAFT_536201 [Lophium mytilinum]|uniref:RING-type domain-containing protein n=1 Tax=Lophium mytilinum TaxID=390894 RepID=A0A6A6R0A9_9PEZI|nr:hypothetical protein BU16DRAFT_536201 [Lophium mytilinum]